MQYAGTRLEPGVVKERENTRAGSVDFPFAALTLLLLTIGVVMVLSASYARAYYSAATGHNAAYYFLRQLGFAAAGTAAMLVLSRLPMAFYRRMSFPLMALSVALLAAVPFIGAAEGGARRWIDLGFTTFQPSEIAKAAVILYFSALICRFRAAMRTFRYGIAPFAGILALIVGLLVLEPHFSAAVIILAIGGAMLFLGGARLYWFVGVGVLGLAGLGVVMTFFPYASGRVATWLDPFANTSGDGYQIVQSLYSIGSGGLFGLGLGPGQADLYVPARGAQRLHLRRRLRGARLRRGGGHTAAFRGAHRPGLLAGHAHATTGTASSSPPGLRRFWPSRSSSTSPS